MRQCAVTLNWVLTCKVLQGIQRLELKVCVHSCVLDLTSLCIYRLRYYMAELSLMRSVYDCVRLI